MGGTGGEFTGEAATGFSCFTEVTARASWRSSDFGLSDFAAEVALGASRAAARPVLDMGLVGVCGAGVRGTVVDGVGGSEVAEGGGAASDASCDVEGATGAATGAFVAP